MNIAILTAGGKGTRTHQDVPKQFITVNNKPIIVYTLEAFQNHPEIDEICIAVLEGWDQILLSYSKQFNITKLKYVVIGGKTGQESIFNCLKAIRSNHKSDDVVVVHDGNRPLVSHEIITNNLYIQRKYGSAVAAVPSTEIIYLSENKLCSNHPIPRDNILKAQTPQSYYLGDLWEAHINANKNGIVGTVCSCSLMEQFGKTTFFSSSSDKNIRITTQEDIDIFTALVSLNNAGWIKK